MPIFDPTAHKARITLERRYEALFSKYCHMCRECFCASAVSLHVSFYNASDVAHEHHGLFAGLLSLILVFHWKHPFTDAHNVTTTRLVTMQSEFWTIKSCMFQSFILFYFFTGIISWVICHCRNWTIC